ncbi:putative Trehalose receptor-containing protein [Homarus americanus]|uniref:Putative Trehalose receptor-containing protein n=1 Tax=Homarus americanus TaxID=6706 RepID=A0A8J5K2C9_HOMAM|nr:putative Trehalose receptor-containing protein [Homarus americanus]
MEAGGEMKGGWLGGLRGQGQLVKAKQDMWASRVERRLRGVRFDEAFGIPEPRQDVMKDELEMMGVLMLPGGDHGAPRITNTLKPPLMPFRILMRILGVMPYTYDLADGRYKVNLKSLAGFHTLLTALYFTALIITTMVGLVTTFTSRETHHTQEEINVFGIKLMVVILIAGNLVNAWAQVLNAIYSGSRLCELLNTWNSLVAAADLDPTDGLYVVVRVQVLFLMLFSVSFMVMAVSGVPAVVHYQLVRLVRETEYIFGPMLQCYYASTVIILCTELYLLAYRIGSSQYSADGVIATSLMTLQTAAVFVQVSLSAAAVQEVKDELTTALTGSPLYITGGKFFVINRPFIITVLSAVVTYFIVMIQFMQPSQSEQQDASNYTLSLNITDVSQLNFTNFSQFNLTDVN